MKHRRNRPVVAHVPVDEIIVFLSPGASEETRPSRPILRGDLRGEQRPIASPFRWGGAMEIFHEGEETKKKKKESLGEER
mmetsp:Transcript_59756/g.177073  ORF Transcript_59756/g.177073 Transcript_59756/m.177073 type:complete len:80 (+) Transcript_59756:80-319(+)